MRPGDCESGPQTALPPPRPNRPPAAEQCPAGPCSFTHRPQGRSLLSPQDGGAAPHLPPPRPTGPGRGAPGCGERDGGRCAQAAGPAGQWGGVYFGGRGAGGEPGLPTPAGHTAEPQRPAGRPAAPATGPGAASVSVSLGRPPRPVPLRPRGAPTRAGLPGGGGGSAPPLPHWFAAEPVTAAAPRLAPAAGAPPGRPPPRPPCAERRGPGTGTALRSAPPRTAPHRSARSGGRAGRAGPSRAEPGGGTRPQHRTAPSSTAQHRTAPHSTEQHRAAPHSTEQLRTAPSSSAPAAGM